LECVEARDAGAAALDDEQLERALREALRGDTVALVAVLQEEARRRFPPPMMGLPAALMTKLLERQRPPRTGSGRGSVLPWRGYRRSTRPAIRAVRIDGCRRLRSISWPPIF
jgi:hypothetical protein